MSGEQEQIKTLTIRNADIIEKVNELAEVYKDLDEKPNPHKTARRLLRESSNAALNHPDLYQQLMQTIARLDQERKKKTA